VELVGFGVGQLGEFGELDDGGVEGAVAFVLGDDVEDVEAVAELAGLLDPARRWPRRRSSVLRRAM
jgi:hypothetical protein